MKSLIISSWLKGEEGDKGLGKFVCWYLADLGSHTAARTYDGPGVAPDHCPTLDLQTGGHLLSPVQQIMDDRHSLAHPDQVLGEALWKPPQGSRDERQVEGQAQLQEQGRQPEGQP